VLPRFGIARSLAERPWISLLLGVAFVALGASFLLGHAPAGDGTVSKGEALVMALSCLVIGGYFVRAFVNRRAKG
jgi:hypothetical protein